MDAAVLGSRLAEVTQKPLLGLFLQCRYGEGPKVLAGLAICEMLSQYPQSAFEGLSGVAGGGQQQFAAQTLRVNLPGIENRVVAETIFEPSDQIILTGISKLINCFD